MTVPLSAKGSAVVLVNLHCRTAPRTTADSLTILRASQTVDVWAVADGWALVQTQADGLTGWCKVAAADGTPYLAWDWTEA